MNLADLEWRPLLSEIDKENVGEFALAYDDGRFRVMAYRGPLYSTGISAIYVDEKDGPHARKHFEDNTGSWSQLWYREGLDNKDLLLCQCLLFEALREVNRLITHEGKAA